MHVLWSPALLVVTLFHHITAGYCYTISQRIVAKMSQITVSLSLTFSSGHSLASETQVAAACVIIINLKGFRVSCRIFVSCASSIACASAFALRIRSRFKLAIASKHIKKYKLILSCKTVTKPHLLLLGRAPSSGDAGGPDLIGRICCASHIGANIKHRRHKQKDSQGQHCWASYAIICKIPKRLRA